MPLYQCIYCKAQYEHDKSYKHNAYDCLKQKGKGMKAGLIGVLVLSLVGLSGCELIDKYITPQKILTGGDRAEITVYKGSVATKYTCGLDLVSEKFVDCVEVK